MMLSHDGLHYCNLHYKLQKQQIDNEDEQMLPPDAVKVQKIEQLVIEEQYSVFEGSTKASSSCRCITSALQDVDDVSISSSIQNMNVGYLSLDIRQ